MLKKFRQSILNKKLKSHKQVKSLVLILFISRPLTGPLLKSIVGSFASVLQCFSGDVTGKAAFLNGTP